MESGGLQNANLESNQKPGLRHKTTHWECRFKHTAFLKQSILKPVEQTKTEAEKMCWDFFSRSCHMPRN